MASIFKPKKSTTAGAVPTTANLADGEMAVNTADRRIFVRVGAAIVELFNRVFNPFNQGNGFVSWTGEATVTPSTSVALLDSTGAALSPTKTYKVAACNIDSSVQRGAVVLFIGDGSSFTRQVVYEAGLFGSNVQLYLNAGVPSVSVYGGSGSYRIPYRIEEVPNFGQGLSEFALVQKINDAPSDGKYYGRKDGAWAQVGQPGVVNVTANTTLSATHLNKVVEVTVAGTVTITIPSGLGAQGDIITVVHSHATGTIYVQGASGVGIYRFGSNTSQSITGIGMMSFYRCSASNTWLAA